MATNKSFQVEAIRRNLRKQGIEDDLVDVFSLVDSTLTLSENARIVSEEVKFMKKFDAGSVQETKSQKKIERFLKAIEQFEKMSIKRQVADSRKQARTSFEKSELTKKNYKKWKKSTNQYDIVGVDSKHG